MARRLNWEKAVLRGKRTTSIKDEHEYLKKSFTSRWLERAEERDAIRKRVQIYQKRGRKK